MFTHVTDFLVFQWNSTMSSITSNDVINVKPNWGCCFFMFFSYLFFGEFNTSKVGTASQYTFPVWKCIIRMRISAHGWICHIRCFRINMTPMWHHCNFICCIYMMCFLNRPSALNIFDLILEFFKYLSRQYINDECTLLA